MKEEPAIIDIMIVGGNYIGKGAEAMMLVTRDQIRRKIPGARLWVKPVNSNEADKLTQDGFHVVYTSKGNKPFRIIQLIFAGFGKKITGVHSGTQLPNIFRATDAVIDISGFASSDQFGTHEAINRLLIYTMAKFAGNKIIFMPQSWGPFQNKSVRRFTRWMLKGASLICAREKTSLGYLTATNCIKPNKVLVSHDIAFLFEKIPCRKTAEEAILTSGISDSSLPYITITPNMRIYERVSGKEKDNTYIKILIEIINYFLINTNRNIILIPFEASVRKQNDIELCILLKTMIKEKLRIGILTAENSAATTKSVIGFSEFLVASRYHSLVAALSLCVPMTVIGWAHKYDELMQNFNLSEFITDPVHNSGNTQTIEIVVKAYNSRKEIVHRIKEKIPEVEKKSVELFEKVKQILVPFKT